jgi:flagellin-like protein
MVRPVNKKGVTPVIAVILLLLMTVAAAGVAYALFSKYFAREPPEIETARLAPTTDLYFQCDDMKIYCPEDLNKTCTKCNQLCIWVKAVDGHFTPKKLQEFSIDVTPEREPALSEFRKGGNPFWFVKSADPTKKCHKVDTIDITINKEESFYIALGPQYNYSNFNEEGLHIKYHGTKYLHVAKK